MILGFSLFLVTAGALAVSTGIAGIDIAIVRVLGGILVVLGLAAGAISLLFCSSLAPLARRASTREGRQRNDRI